MSRRPDSPVAECVALFREGHTQALLYRAWRLPPPDLADVLAALTSVERRHLVTLLPPKLAARGMIELPIEAEPDALLAALPSAIAAEIVRALDDDDAAYLLSSVSSATRESILGAVEKRQMIDHLLHFDAGTAGRIMTTAVISVTESDPIPLAVESVRRQAGELAGVDDIYVVDVGRHLVGMLSFRSLVMANSSALVREAMDPVIERVSPTDRSESVTRRLQRYHLTSLPVVDDTGRLLGRIAADDVADVAAAEAAGTLLRFAGVSPDEELRGRWPTGIRSRLPMLYTNLLTAFFTAALVHAVTNGTGRLLPLLVWMPIVAGMGGNAGLQSLAYTWHRLAQGRQPWNRRRMVLARELAVGSVNGAVIGVIVGGVAVLVGETWRAGVVVALAILLQLPVASGLSAILPMVLRRAGLDPGIASAPTVSTLLDVIGLVILLSLGALIL